VPNSPSAPLERDLALDAVRAISSGLLVVDRAGTIAYANPSAATLLGCTLEDLVGAKSDDVLGVVDLAGIEKKSPSRGEVRLARKDGRRIVIGFSVSALGAGRFVCLFQEISGQVELMRERDRLLQRAIVAELLPSILHELKNPLASIAATTELLLEEVAEESVVRDLKAVRREAYRMDLGIQGFAVAGRDLRSMHAVQIDTTILEAIQILERLASEARIRLQSTVDSMPPLMLSAEVIRGMVFNLVRSSLASCRTGEEVSFTAKLLDRDTTLELCVRDPSQTLAVLDSTPGVPIGRVGVALLLCKRACEAARGTLSIGRSADGGSETRIRIPQAREASSSDG
jgi:PAS domain S-box-containing protein